MTSSHCTARGAVILVAAALAACGKGSDVDRGFTLDASSVSFRAVQGAAAPAPQRIHVRVTAADAYYLVAGHPPGTSPPSWLATSLTGASSDWTLSLSVSSTALSPGTYQVPVRVAAARSDQSVIGYQDVAVSLQVVAGIAASPAALSFRHVAGASGAPAAQSLSVGGTSGTAFTASADQPWVRLGGTSGTVPAALQVSVDGSALALGTHSATVTLSGGPEPVSVPVSLTLAQPTLTATPSVVTLGGASGHDVTPATVALSLDTGAAAHAWSAGPAPAWLRLSASSGTVSSAAQTIGFAPDAVELPAGTYTATVPFSAQVNGTTITSSVRVTLALDEHRLLASDDGVALVSAPGATALSRSLRIRSNRGASTTWRASSDAAWLTATAAGSTADALVISGNPSGLDADALYEGVVTVASDNPTITGTIAIRVGLWVGSAAPASRVSLATAYGQLVADPVRPYAYVNAGGPDITVYNVFTGAVVRTLAGVGARLGNMAVSSDGTRLFAVDESAHAVVPIDLSSGSAGTPWPLGSAVAGARLAWARPGGTGALLVGGSIRRASTGVAYGPAVPGAFSGGLRVSRDGGTACYVNAHVSPCTLSCQRLDLNSLTDQLALGAQRTGWAGSNGRDVAVSPDGSRAYVAAGSPYSVSVYDIGAGATPAWVADLPADPYPAAVVVSASGRVFGAASSMYGAKDIWAYEPSGAAVTSWRASGYAQEVIERQLAVSGDGLRLAVITSDPSLQFLAVPP